MRDAASMLAVFVLILSSCAPSSARCACSSGSSYNFLGDPEMDMDMDGYDEFVRENAKASTISVPDPAVLGAAESRVLLGLDDSSQVDLLLKRADRDFAGQGNITTSNETSSVRATGSLQGERLSLDVMTSKGVLYSFKLAWEGSTLLGEYKRTMTNGENLTGIADGKWTV